MANTLADKTIIAAEGLLDIAETVGREAGYPKGGAAALHVLEEAFAMALADAVNFGEDPQRLEHVVDEFKKRIADRVKIHCVLRKVSRRPNFLKH